MTSKNHATECNFWTNMITAVKADADLSYVTTWLDGSRYIAALPEDLPAVIFLPVAIDEEFQYTPDKMSSKPTFRIIGILRVTDIDKAIAGDADNIGILKLDEDLKNALDVHFTASNGARCVELKTVSFTLPENIQAGNTQTATLVCVIEAKITENLLFTIGQR